MLLGVDLSHFQDPTKIDWAEFARQGVKFAFARATYGVVPDMTFQKHVRRAHAAGIVVGAYHFLRFKADQPGELQAAAFLGALEPVSDLLHIMLPPALDLEENVKNGDLPTKTATDRKKYREQANAWLQKVEQSLSRTAIIYTGRYFFDDVFGTNPGYGARPLWIAHYTSQPAPRLPAAWKRHSFWQFTETGQLDGYSGGLDLNRFDGSEADLKKLVTQPIAQPAIPAEPAGMESVTRTLGGSGATLKRINAPGANLRTTPEEIPSNISTTLPLASDVEILAANVNTRWAHVRTILNGQAVTGYVAHSLLRPRQGDDAEKLVSAAVREWLRFNRGEGKETVVPFRGYIGEMWDAINLPYDGGDTNMFWSAAAISFFARNAGPAYGNFRFSQRHSDYIKDAIAKRNQGAAAPFWGYRLSERKPKIGDIVACWREARTSFDSAQTKTSFPSHCDVIVATAPGLVRTLGGNVSDSVSLDTYALNTSGYLKPQGAVFALLVNQT